MSQPPRAIHIDDLANPRLPEAVHALNAVSLAEARREVPLGEDSLFDEARSRTGLRPLVSSVPSNLDQRRQRCGP